MRRSRYLDSRCDGRRQGRRGAGRPPRAPAAALALGAALALLGLVPAPPLGPAPARAVDELDYGLEAHRLKRIVLAGNEAFSDSDLKSVLQIREPSWLHPLTVPVYRPDLLETQTRVLERFYQQRGFHQAVVVVDSIVTVQGEGDVLHLSVREGPRTILDEIVFEGAGPLPESELRARLLHREGGPVPADPADLGRDVYELRSLYWEHAYLEVRIEPVLLTYDTEDPRRRSATLRYEIEPGRRYIVSGIRVLGNLRTRRELISRELRLETGEPFRWQPVERSRRDLLDTALFRDVSLRPADLDTATGTAELEVAVVERRPAFYELGGGIGSRERVRLLGAWAHNNLWGSGRRLQLRGKLYWNVEQIAGSGPIGSEIDLASEPRSSPEINYRTDVLYVNPHLRGSRFRLDVNLYAEKETRGESGLNLYTHGFSFGTRFRGGPQTLTTVALQLEQSDPRLHPDVTDPALRERFAQANIRSTQTRSLVSSLLLEGRDDVFRPRHGSLTNLQVELAGGVLGGDNSFVRGVVSYHHYLHFPLGGTLAMRASTGVARPYGSSLERGEDGVPYSKRFFAGGVSTVRGYLENSLGPQITDPALRDSLQFASDVPLPDNPARGGNYLLLTNAEWRFPLPLLSRWKLGGVFFLDGGNVWERIGDIRLRGFRLRSEAGDPVADAGQPPDEGTTKVWDYRWSLGTGLRLDTPFGPFRIDVGWPLKRALGEDRVMYHFSLGYPF